MSVVDIVGIVVVDGDVDVEVEEGRVEEYWRYGDNGTVGDSGVVVFGEVERCAADSAAV